MQAYVQAAPGPAILRESRGPPRSGRRAPQGGAVPAVIFDMDGVIIDSEPLHFRAERRLFAELGLTIDAAEHQGFVGQTTRAMWGELRRRYGLRQPLEELVASSRRYIRELIAAAPAGLLVPGLTGCLEYLRGRGLTLLLASSSEAALIDLVLKKFGLEIYFSQRVSGDEVRRGKPAPDIFLLAAGRAGVPPADCLVVEDSAHGVQAAKAAGMACIGFRNPASGRQDLSAADAVITRFDQIRGRGLLRLLDRRG
jgi:HAD superfamily hydrolase (TIGR01509 family)